MLTQIQLPEDGVIRANCHDCLEFVEVDDIEGVLEFQATHVCHDMDRLPVSTGVWS